MFVPLNSRMRISIRTLLLVAPSGKIEVWVEVEFIRARGSCPSTGLVYLIINLQEIGALAWNNI